MSYERSNSLNSLRSPLIFLGMVLIIVGVTMLLYVTYLVFTVLNEPGQVKIVEYVMNAIRDGDMAINGSFKDAQDPTRDIKFELLWSQSVRTILFLFMGIAVASFLARTLGVLITTGIALMNLATGDKRPGKKYDNVV